MAFVVGAAGEVAGAVYVPGRLTEELSFDVPAVYGAALTAMQELELKLFAGEAGGAGIISAAMGR